MASGRTTTAPRTTVRVAAALLPLELLLLLPVEFPEPESPDPEPPEPEPPPGAVDEGAAD